MQSHQPRGAILRTITLAVAGFGSPNRIAPGSRLLLFHVVPIRHDQRRGRPSDRGRHHRDPSKEPRYSTSLPGPSSNTFQIVRSGCSTLTMRLGVGEPIAFALADGAAAIVEMDGVLCTIKVGSEPPLDRLEDRGRNGCSEPMPRRAAVSKHLSSIPRTTSDNRHLRLLCRVLDTGPFGLLHLVKPLNNMENALF
ncbi:hypothetical protein HNQ71_006638 [Mesorhizobium sangaii]|uniref:Uncharacterized protein n=1 Tax=Mesorhizobium sangaii TaxID=505389 RepID=A0A841PUU0_9HYPH|nr:hypothetical protein [Mesorhizobium sangaii]